MLLGIYSWFTARMVQLRAQSERGAAAVEYGLLVALIAVAVVVAIGLLGTKLNATFCEVVARLPFTPNTCPSPAP